MRSKQASTQRGPGREAAALARENVRALLEKSPAFRQIPPEAREATLTHAARAAAYLIEPDGIRLPLGSEGPLAAVQAESLLGAMSFPEFVAGLVRGVFEAIVNASIAQMEAYGQLVAEVSKSVEQFMEENVSGDPGRDHLVDQYPDVFEIDSDRRVRLLPGVDPAAALGRINLGLPIDGWPVSDLDEKTIEQRLVPAARRHLAGSRQQMLAGMVLMGMHRLIGDDKTP